MSSSSQAPIQNPLHLPTPSAPSIRGFVPSHLSPSYSIRHAHILRLYDLLLVLVSQPPGRTNAVQCVRAWTALAKCHEVDLIGLYKIGGVVLERAAMVNGDEEGEERRQWTNRRKAEWYKVNLSGGKDDKCERLNEFVLALTAAGQAREALDELQSYLPAHPYHDSIPLNVLAGQLALLVAQSPTTSTLVATANSKTWSDDSSDLEPAANLTETSGRRSMTEFDSGHGKGVVLDENVPPDAAVHAFLRGLASSSPILYNQAREHFRQASRLELKHEHLSHGEATRWLRMMDASDATKFKRARSFSNSPSP